MIEHPAARDGAKAVPHLSRALGSAKRAHDGTTKDS